MRYGRSTAVFLLLAIIIALLLAALSRRANSGSQLAELIKGRYQEEFSMIENALMAFPGFDNSGYEEWLESIQKELAHSELIAVRFDFEDQKQAIILKAPSRYRSA